ncbi:MAG: phosphoribosylanthranilate isomerase [Fimbriiglobus sp.]|jgi:phosphoribosylanthranilate isomerase|nr:phosphoribosylanthranilate isomerase [Fimbriiglobus sp.]
MTRIKICGITTPADAELLAELGVEAVGLNFYHKSPRCVAPERAGELVKHLGPFVATVGVFVTNDYSTVYWTCETFKLGLRAVQTYSDSPPALPLAPFAHIPAFRVKDSSDLAHIQQFVIACRPAAVLVDSFVTGEMGGTGHRAPWELLVGFDPGVPLILAGGLTPDNVAEAIRLVKPWGVDVASGVEASPGRKDPSKVRAFVAAVRGSFSAVAVATVP